MILRLWQRLRKWVLGYELEGEKQPVKGSGASLTESFADQRARLDAINDAIDRLEACRHEADSCDDLHSVRQQNPWLGDMKMRPDVTWCELEDLTGRVCDE